MKKLTKTLVAIGALCITTPALAADMVIGVPNWPSVQATAYILKEAIEQNLGLDVEIQNGTNPIVFEAMDKGAMHVHPEVWLPNQQNLYDTYVKQKKTVVRNENGVAAFQGMCVDKKTADKHGIRKISDLTNPDIAGLFDSNGNGQGELWIGAPGWASTNIEKIRAKSYGYDQVMELTVIEENVAYADLATNIKAGKPWAGFCYTPHYVFALHDMQVLEEPKYEASKWKVIQPTDSPSWLEDSSAPVAWDLAYLHIHYAKALEKDYPEVANFLSNVKFDTDAVSQMTFALVVDKKEASAYAKEWVKDNEGKVLKWMSG